MGQPTEWVPDYMKVRSNVSHTNPDTCVYIRRPFRSESPYEYRGIQKSVNLWVKQNKLSELEIWGNTRANMFDLTFFIKSRIAGTHSGGASHSVIKCYVHKL